METRKEDTKTVLGERIKQLRSFKLHMNQRQFADALGIQPSTLSGYENGNIVPSADILLRIAQLYHISLDWLFGLTNEQTPFSNLGEVVAAILQIDNLSELRFEIERNKPDTESEDDKWYCLLKFYGNSAEYMNNGDVCSFLDSLYEHRAEFESYFESLESYEQWKESVIAYYSDIPVTQKPREALDYDERIARRNALLEAKK